MNVLKEILESVLLEKIYFTSSRLSGISTQIIRTESGKQYFLKAGTASPAYRCEADGLTEIEKTGAVKTPKVIASDENFILTEYIHPGKPDVLFFEKLGKRLAQMHRFQSPYFGFFEDNYIGANPQFNIPSETEKNDWITFFFNKRLLVQYKSAEKNGYAPVLAEGFINLEKNIHKILSGSGNTPCLLHGDLWSGNYLSSEKGEPVLIDPAVYYGCREADLAMTKLFGGFPPDFYHAYHHAYPLPEGWEYRENVYKLYHVLNHLNLFGASYLRQAEQILRQYAG